ncbi:hypothetical protein [Nitrosomonas communis]|uniref:Uncharacterized protein n=1 Tax=Nitrosomonas communis TaxID=44574 RepID=A0A1I4U0C4_9PROT|nr:hypothetical protein [Nitrosomonas communis]SFM82518.1 hypothetical protein SAMN05421863_105720 [Nitrosomonas communis]
MTILKLKQIDEVAHLIPGTAEAMVKQVESLSKSEQKIFTKALSHLADGKRIPLKLLNEVLPLFEKLNIKYHLEWDELFDEILGHFRHRKLQEQYYKYLDIHSRTEAEVTPSQWARRTRGGSARLFRLMLGENYFKNIGKSKGGVKIFVKLADVVRPDSLDDVKLGILLTMLKANPKLLFRRLDKFFASDNYSNTLVNLGHMNNAKGNIGEIIALVEQRAIVRELIATYATLPFAKNIDLVTGIIVKGQGEFSDNFIGYIDDAGDLNVLAIIEVKNWADRKLGLEKAKLQFFEWLEGGIDEGVTLTMTYRENEKKFVYDPELNSDEVKKVKGIFRSKKYILYIGKENLGSVHRYAVGYSGRSPMGLDFDTHMHGGGRITFDDGKRTVGQVQVRPVEGVTTAELDYLAALLLKSKGQF